MNTRYWALAGVVAVGACTGKSDVVDVVDALEVPRIRPPVQAALPPALIQGGTPFSARLAPGAPVPVDYIKTCATDITQDYCLTLTGTDRLRCHLKQRLFCPGPTEVLSLLDRLDAVMIGIEAGSSGTEPCLSAVPADHTSDLTFPGNKPFTHYLQCKDSTNPAQPIGFGVKDGSWYIRTSGPVGGWLFSVDANDDLVNGYQWGNNVGNEVGGMLRIASSKTAGSVEFVGEAAGFCAIHYASNQANIWILINEVGVGMPRNCDANFDGTTNAADYAELCLDATTLEVADVASCATLKSNKTLTLIGLELAPTPATEMIDFLDLATATALNENGGTMANVAEFH